MYKELANGIAQLIPLVNAQEGTIDENSEAYKRLMIVLEEVGIPLNALAEIQERIKTANEDATKSAIDAAQAERDRQELYDDISKSLGPMEQIQAKFNDQLAKAGKVAWQSSQDVLAYVDALRVWKAEQETLAGYQAAGDFGPIAAMRAEDTFGREVRGPLQSLMQQDADNPALREMWEKALKFRELQHQNELDEIENKQALFDLNQGLLDSTLTLGEAGTGVTTAMAQGFGQVALQSMNLAGNIQQITSAAIGGLSRQLGLLATGAKADFKQVATSFVQMITQMIVQLTAMLAIVTAIKAMGGGGILAMMGLGGAVPAEAANTATSTLSTTTSSMLQSSAQAAISVPKLTYPGSSGAAGRPMRAGMPYMVGERGPELFVPPQSGSLKSNREMNMMAQQPPQVTIVNVDSMDNTLNALGSEEAEGIILNVIQRNPEIIRSLG
jgi:lambda family phage tail tape measure protein